MECFARAGQRSAALRQYRECARILERELGVPPLAETTALYEAIREQRIQPAAPRPVAAPAAEARALFTFVGRADELATLQGGWARVGPDGMVLALEGEAGVGKTRLAEEFLAQVRLRGGVTLSARCYEGEASMSYVPLVEALRRAGDGVLARGSARGAARVESVVAGTGAKRRVAAATRRPRRASAFLRGVDHGAGGRDARSGARRRLHR